MSCWWLRGGGDQSGNPREFILMPTKQLIDQYLAPVARMYRLARDSRDPIRGTEPVPFEGGLRLYGDSKASVDYRSQSHEIAVLDIGLSDCDLFIDVGANIGLFSCYAAKKGVPSVAIEPSAYNLRILLENILMNSVKNIEVFPVAISREPGIMKFYGSGQGASLVKGWGGIAANYSSYVPVNSLDSLMIDRCRGKRVFVKIDAEGSELDVVLGASKLCDMSPSPMLMMEIGFDENFSGGINPDYRDIFKFFFDRGYDCFAVELKKRMSLEIVDS
jgi:FkbM family methyltransferase